MHVILLLMLLLIGMPENAAFEDKTFYVVLSASISPIHLPDCQLSSFPIDLSFKKETTKDLPTPSLVACRTIQVRQGIQLLLFSYKSMKTTNICCCIH